MPVKQIYIPWKYSNMHLLIVGSEGRLGRTLMKIFPGSSSIDLENEDQLQSELTKADFALLAVPLEETVNIIRSFPEYRGFVDLTSMKYNMEEFSGHIISIHPLFGPESYKTNKTIIFINDISTPDSLDKVKELFNGYRIISMNAREHDYLMSELLVKPYILSYISEASNTDIVTGSYIKFLEIEKIKHNENTEIFLDTIKYNERAMEIIINIEKKLDELKKLIGNR